VEKLMENQKAKFTTRFKWPLITAGAVFTFIFLLDVFDQGQTLLESVINAAMTGALWFLLVWAGMAIARRIRKK